MALGLILRNRRKELGLTLDEVAAAAGFSKPYLSTVETGKTKNPPSEKVLVRLEKVLKFKSAELRRIAHIDRIPADLRRDYEALDAEIRQYKQIIQKIINRDLKPTQVDKVLAEHKLDIEETTSPNPASSWVPIINKVMAGYPSQFSDMGIRLAR
jgi:transcriptional regulator with XRE-family HTH domain